VTNQTVETSILFLHSDLGGDLHLFGLWMCIFLNNIWRIFQVLVFSPWLVLSFDLTSFFFLEFDLTVKVAKKYIFSSFWIKYDFVMLFERWTCSKSSL
jgi:hypothetical protein